MIRSSMAGLTCTGKSGNRGYTLIESAIAIMVLGLIMTSFLSAYRIYMKTEAQQVTLDNESKVKDAITSFFAKKGRYPCPASLTAKRDDPSYGLERQCDSAVANDGSVNINYPKAIDYAAGTFVDTDKFGKKEGTYIEWNKDDITQRVRRGAIPFISLGIREEEALDGYHQRIQYVVTEKLAGNPLDYDKDDAGITIQTNGGNSVQKVAGVDKKFQYIIFSSGPDGKGAFSNYGSMIQPCDTTTADGENCNTAPSLLATTNRAIYYYAERNDVTTGAGKAQHFDDFMVFGSTKDTPLWRIMDEDSLDIRDLVGAENVDAGKVRIGLNSPDMTGTIPEAAIYGSSVGATINQSKRELEVAGDVNARDMIRVGAQVCGTNGADCFTPQKVTPTDSTKRTYNCGSGTGQIVGSFSNDQANCNTPAVGISCPAGQLLSRINTDGSLACTAVVGCTTQSVTLCSGTTAQMTWPIPPDKQGATIKSPIAGISYYENWTCGSNRLWSKSGSGGICVCTAVDETYNQDCNAYKNYNGNWTGYVTWHHTIVCPSKVETTVMTANTCQCAAKTTTGSASCPSGSSGTITTKQDWTCSSSTAGSYGAVVTTSNTCTCSSLPDDTKTEACPSPQSGQIKSKRSWTCASATAGSWGSWVVTSNTCACTAGNYNYQSLGCVSPLVGTRIQRQEYDCTTSTWGPFIDYSSNCGTVAYTWHSKSGSYGSGASPLSNVAGGSCSPAGSTSACSQASGSGNYSYFSLCSCE